MNVARDYVLPTLPHGWAFHVGAKGYEKARFTLTLCDATVYERIAFGKENPGQAREGTPSYETLLSQGVRVAQATDIRGWRKLRKIAAEMAETAWVVDHARDRLRQQAETRQRRSHPNVRPAGHLGGER